MKAYYILGLVIRSATCKVEFIIDNCLLSEKTKYFQGAVNS